MSEAKVWWNQGSKQREYTKNKKVFTNTFNKQTTQPVGIIFFERQFEPKKNENVKNIKSQLRKYFKIEFCRWYKSGQCE